MMAMMCNVTLMAIMAMMAVMAIMAMIAKLIVMMAIVAYLNQFIKHTGIKVGSVRPIRVNKLVVKYK